MKIIELLRNHRLVFLSVVCVVSLVLIGILVVNNKTTNINEAIGNVVTQEPEKSTSSLNATEGVQIPLDSVSTPATTPKPILIKGMGSVTIEGASSNINLTFPKEGGAISGTVSGFCHGSISGTFEKSSSKASGTLKGVCMLISATGTFDGSINLDTKTGTGSLSGSGGQYTKNGIWKITLE
ncbi:MAG: hypothetical protein ACD_40C00179G0004 [uncultured bacterium]|nr:MAG: hypothetical protein ACD_40C00179G0004 [uncultured bacterium]